MRHFLFLTNATACPTLVQNPANRSRSIGMKFIQHQKLQPLSGSDDLLIEGVLPGEDVLQHHVVRQQDVRRVVLNPFPFRIFVLAGIAREANFLGALWIAVAEILLQLFELAVAQGIHRVDDDRPNALGGVTRPASRDDALHHRQDVADRLAGTGAGGEDDTATGEHNLERLQLVEMQL